MTPIPTMPPIAGLPFEFDRTEGWTRMREIGDIAISEDGAYFLIGAEVVEAAAKNAEAFSSARAFEFLGSPVPLVPIAIDPPHHSRFRRMLNKFFTPRMMLLHENEFRQRVDSLIDDIVANGPQCDVVSALAVPFPTHVFLTLFGLPIADVDRLVTWKDSIVQLVDPQSVSSDPVLLAAAAELFEYLRSKVTGHVDEGHHDLLSELLRDNEDGGFTHDEILGLCFIFMLAGLDTVTAAIGFAVHRLAVEPDLRTRLFAEPAALSTFVEEIIRVEGPVPTVPRVTTRDIDLGGVTIPEGTTCWLMFGAASRDPRHYDSPDTISETRSVHFGFGRGVHSCLGAHLARLELRIVVEQWLRRIGRFELVAAPAVRWPSGTLTLSRLDLRIAAADEGDSGNPDRPAIDSAGSLSYS